MINGGYYIKARKIQESEISQASPCTRELWDWLLMTANHKDKISGGFLIKRGQTFRTIKQICDALSWRIGFRIQRYNEEVMKKAMKWLRSRGMIDTMKSPRGNIITVCNYDIYQNPKNYEIPMKAPMKDLTISPPIPLSSPSINKNDKNYNNENNNNTIVQPDLVKSVSHKKSKKYYTDVEYIEFIENYFREYNIAEAKTIYPNINYQAELLKAKIWLIENKTKRRTKLNSFLLNWFEKANKYTKSTSTIIDLDYYTEGAVNE